MSQSYSSQLMRRVRLTRKEVCVGHKTKTKEDIESKGDYKVLGGGAEQGEEIVR